MGQPSVFRIFTKPPSEGLLNEVAAAALATGFSGAFKSGTAQAVAIRKGILTADEEMAREAFKLLDKMDVVVGPALEGQLYLIGTRNAHQGVLGALLTSIDLGSPHPLEEIMYQCQKRKLSLWVMETQSGPVAARKAGSWV